MGKRRKREQLTQDEIWDDSALLKSWQGALDEYQFYHSIHAKGENVEDILRQAESADNVKKEDVPSARSLDGQASVNGDIEEGEVDEQEEVVVGEQAAYKTGEKASAQSSAAHNFHPSSRTENPVDASASMNQGQVLENIKMAYWWAGYYSGMYDAKQAGTQPSEK